MLFRSVAGLRRPLRVRLQAPSLHEVDDEGHDPEVEKQVLAAVTDEDEVVSVRGTRLRRRRLEGSEGKRREALEGGPGEVGVEPLGVCVDLG